MIIENELNPQIKDILFQRQLQREIREGRGRETGFAGFTVLRLITYKGGEANDIVPIEDPEIKNLFNPLTEEEYQSLKASIQTKGLIEKIIVDQEYKIISGYHRYRAWKELGYDPKQIEVIMVSFKTNEARIQFASDSNVKRRQMTEYQKVEANIRVLNELRKYATPGARTDLYADITSGSIDPQVEKSAKHKSKVQEFAKEIGVPYGTCKRLLKVYNTQLPGTEEIKEQLRAGKISTYNAYSEIKKIEKKNQRMNDEANKTKTASNPQPTTITLFHGDFHDVMKTIPDNSINMIITDPPYDIHIFTMDKMKQLAEQSARVLKDDGALVMVHDVDEMPHIISNMTQYLDFYWLIIDPKVEFNQEIKNKIDGETVKVHKSKKRNDVSFLNGYKPIYVFCKKGMEYKLAGRLERITFTVRNNLNYYEDIIWNTKTPKNKIHEHEQSEEMMRQLITMFTAPDDVILEPFTGSGTTLRTGREPEFKIKEIIGVEVNMHNISVLETILNVRANCVTHPCEIHPNKNP